MAIEVRVFVFKYIYIIYTIFISDYIINNTIHLVAEVSNKNPFLNEAISVTYKLYVSPDTGVDNWRELDAPRYANFWSNNICIN